jgi:hypothetical protein
LNGVSTENPAGNRTVSARKGPGFRGVSTLNPAENRTVSAETPPQTPPQTPRPNARAGREPQNHRTRHPPNPPKGGRSLDHVIVEQLHRTPAGRARRRPVRIDLADVRRDLGLPTAGDRAAWNAIRGSLRTTVSESTFDIWLDPLELIAVDDSSELVIAAPSELTPWTRQRFGRVIAAIAETAERRVRFAEDHEQLALRTAYPDTTPSSGRVPQINEKEIP